MSVFDARLNWSYGILHAARIAADQLGSSAG